MKLTDIDYFGNGFTATFDDGSVANVSLKVIDGVLQLIGLNTAQAAALVVFNTHDIGASVSSGDPRFGGGGGAPAAAAVTYNDGLAPPTTGSTNVQATLDWLKTHPASLDAVLGAGNTALTHNILVAAAQAIDAALASGTLNLGTTNASVVVFGNGATKIFINQTGPDNGSSADLQISALVANGCQVRSSQYGANAGVPGISTFKSRGTTIGALAPVIPGDVIARITAVGVASNLSIPLSGLVSVTVAPNGVPAGQGWIATDFDIQLVPLAGPINGRKQMFRLTSEGIIHIREAANTMAGLAVLDGTGTAVVNNTQVTTTTKFNLTAQDGGSPPTGVIYQSARAVGTSFTIKSAAGGTDAGVQVYYQLWEPTA